MAGSIVCPPKASEAWKSLVSAVGDTKAYIAFFRAGHEIPDVESAKVHLSTKPAGYSFTPAAPAVVDQAAGQAAVGVPEVPPVDQQGAVPAIVTPPRPVKIAIEDQPMQGKDSQRRIAEIDKELAAVDKKELKLGPFRKNVEISLSDERRTLLEERLRRQSELGITEADDALAKHGEAIARSEGAGTDEDQAIREFARSNPLITPKIAAQEKATMAGELKHLYESVPHGIKLRMFTNKGTKDIDGYGQRLAEHLATLGIHSKDPETYFPTEGAVLDRIEQAFAAPPKKLPMPLKLEITRPIVPSAPARAIVVKPEPFEYGAVIDGHPSVDFRTLESGAVSDNGPAEWATELNRSLDAGRRGSNKGNRSETRVAVALLGPDGRVEFRGLVKPQQMPRVGRVSRSLNEVAIQGMGRDVGGERTIDANGNRPAHAEDVVTAGFKPIAVIHFDGDPAKINKTYENVAAFDEAWQVSEKTKAPDEIKQAATDKKVPKQFGFVEKTAKTEESLQRQIDDLGRRLTNASAGEAKALEVEIDKLYNEQDDLIRRNQTQTGNTNDMGAADAEFVPFRTIKETEHLMPVSAQRAHEFQTVAGRIRNEGGRVDEFAKEMFAQASADVIRQQIDSLKAKMDGAGGPAKRALQEAISYREQRIRDLNDASGVTFNAWHIAVAMRNIQQADVGDLVKLLHEASEQTSMKLNTVMRGQIVKAVEASVIELRERAAAAAEQTGVPLARETGAIDLLSETIAQKLAAQGVPDHPTIAGQIVRWVKELYYRVAMAAQRAFGGEPDPKLAMDWFENQMNRLVFGDYDHRMGRMLDRFMKESTLQVSRRFASHSGTPGGVMDFFDPIDQNMRQPWVDPTSSDALTWNIAFRTHEGEPGKELDIPDPEARARIDSAANNHLLEFAEQVHKQIAPDMAWDKFWAMARGGQDPKILIGEQEGRFPGSKDAKIGGDGMTKEMDGLAQLRAYRLLKLFNNKVLRDSAKTKESAESSADALTALARQVNKLEGDVRNAALHDDVLKQKGKDLVRQLVRDYSRGLDTAETHGELARAVRESENLMESDPIPERFQQVFKSISDGGISIFGYMKELAGLDLDVGSMTNREVLKAIRDNSADSPVLEELSRNRPLAVTLAVLARKNADQVDQIQLGWLRNSEQFQAIHNDLDEIRDASGDKLKAMQAASDERIKTAGLRDRMKRGYLKQRQKLKAAQARVDRAIEKGDLLDKIVPKLVAKVEEMQISGHGSYSEWSPSEGSKWNAMKLQEDGSWAKSVRTLQFNPDGSAMDSAGIRHALAENRLFLEQNADKAGSNLYETVKRQTLELAGLDVQRKYEAGHVNWLDRWVQPVSDEAGAMGGAGSRIKQMLLRFDSILYAHRSELQSDSHIVTEARNKVMAAAGMKDEGEFTSQIYQPIMYFLGTNPGLEEASAIRKATRMARDRIGKPVSDDFNAKFADFLRKTKVSSDKIESIARKEGALVKDQRLGGELRHAVARGWITAMRSADGSMVATIIHDMEKNGWKLEMKEEKLPDGSTRRKVGKATTFDHLRSEDVGEKQTDQLRGALKQYFTPGIVSRWLEPFINKGGIEIMKYAGEAIPQQDLQTAWEGAGGDVLTWIDGVGQLIGLEPPSETNPDPQADFRLSVLHQLNGLFGMESRIAYDAAESRSMFDPMGPKPHVIMDARENDLLPPEHLKFQNFDPRSSRMLLGQIAFHSAFGRNGERMVRTVDELKSSIGMKHQEYQSLKSTTKSGRVAEASARGWNYKDLEVSARKYESVLQLQQKLEGIFGVNNPAGPFNDMRTGMEVLHSMAGQIVDNPKVGLYHVISLLERPFAMHSFGPMAIRSSAGAMAEFGKTLFGSLLENFNIHLLHSSEYGKEVAAAQGQAFRNLPYSTILAGAGQDGKYMGANRYFIWPLRMLRAIQQKGVRIGIGEGARDFPRLALIPGLGSLNTIMQSAGMANALTHIRMMETIVSKGIRYFSTHREDYESPTFRFKAGDLVGRWDKGVFDTFQKKTVEYGMGTLEDIVRSSMASATKGERLISKDQVLRLSQMAMNELDGASSMTTTPGILQSNPLLRIGMPLLRWPLWKMHQTHEGLKDVAGRQNFVSMMKGLGTLAVWNLPMGLAFSFVMDKYDEDLLHKRSAMPEIDKMAMIPVVGPGLALVAGDHSAMQNLIGFGLRAAKAGNIYGLGADMAAQFAAPTDPNSGRRVFSLDQRVLVMSQFLNFFQAASNLVHQGGDATWATVWKPFMASLGGNAALQSVDIVNNALGLDNAESRLVSRINAQNWLRAAGEEAGIELRSSGGGSSNPTQTGLWVREMQLAAMAGDRLGFLDAHRKALAAARKAVSDDPAVPQDSREREAVSRVLAAWKARDPREVFRFKLTPAQYSAVLQNMDDQGKQDVTQAIQRYNQFSALITPTPFERTIERQMAAAERPPGGAQGSLRARQNNSGLLFASP